MQEIINISKNRIGDNTVNSVSARDLHKRLEVKRDFSTWIKNRITKYGFVENEDYIIIAPQKRGAGNNGLFNGSDKIEYILSLDMSKELAMIENNDIGRNIRKYFIKIEQKFSQKLEKQEEKRISPKDIQEMSELGTELIKLSKVFGFKGNQVILSADKGVRNITGHSPLKLLDEIHLVANEKTKIFSPTQLGKEIGKTAMEINLLLADIGFQKKVGKIWEVLESGLEFAELLDTNKKHSDGTPVKQIKWQKEVLEKIKIEKSEPTLF